MKKILSLILAGLMSLSCAAFVAADDAATEVAADPYQDYAIEFLANYGIFKGGEGLTNEDLIQRYQMALFVSRISTGWVDDEAWEDGPANNSTFEDINDEPASKYLGALSYANQNGIIEGYSATKFAPYDSIIYRDALAMVVRALGYKGLNYPWGYIQEAVELGLTEGVDAAYTDELTRGEVAIIIYNAMFAATKSGETLAKSIFDVDFGWKNIVIVATDEGGYNNIGERAATGYVGFKLLNDDGSLSTKTYYVKSAELALEGHEEEIELGAVYAALFTIDGDLASMIDADSLNYATVVNNGRTDNEGAAYSKLPILTALEPYTLVSKTADGKYITFMGNELFVYATGEYTWYTDKAELVGIDWATGNIMVRDEATDTWSVAWYYNETLDKYYDYFYNEVEDSIAINWMSDAEFADWYAKAIKSYAGTETQYVLKTDFTGFGTNPYAKLRLYDTDADGLAEVATYKDYAIGYFSTGTMNCKVGNKNNVNHPDTAMKSYHIADLDSDKDLIANVDVWAEAGHEAHDGLNGIYAWINVAEDVVGFVKEDGTYNNGVVLYNYNKTTGEIEIVKYIPEGAEGTDADSYYVTGILQAYSTKGASITVDGEKYYYGYDALVGTTLKVGDGSMVARRPVATELDEYLMQYVKVLVVDGLVVDVDLLNESREVVVVLDYAGVTSDGYIAVYGYSTADGALGLYKINSYNGWKKGDYRYYPANADEDNAFDAGTIYVIKSWDSETNSYGVETYSIEEMRDGVALSTIEFDSGYRVITGAYAGTEKAASSDCYIIITEYGPMYVTTGSKVGGSWKVEDAQILYKDGGKVVMFADAANVTGFTNTANEIGFVLYDKDYGVALEAAYDDAQGVDGFYLLGSTVTEVGCFNLLTGKNDYYFASTNVDLDHGNVYMTVGNTIVTCVYDTNDGVNNYANIDFLTAVANYYKETSVGLAKYIVIKDAEGIKDYAFLGSNGLSKLTIATDLGVVPNTQNSVIIDNAVNSYISEIRYRLVTEDGALITIDDAALDANTVYVANVLYNCADKVAVVYIYADENIVFGSDSKNAGDSWYTVEEWLYEEGQEYGMPDVESSLDFDWFGGFITMDGENAAAKINGVQLAFNTINAEHDDIAMGGYLFGLFDGHDLSNFGFNDSMIKVVSYDEDGEKVEQYYRADELNYVTMDVDGLCDTCAMVDGIWVNGLDITLYEGDIAYVRFEINGETADGSEYGEGNNISVVLKLTFTDGEVVVEIENDLVINDGNGLNSVVIADHIG